MGNTRQISAFTLPENEAVSYINRVADALQYIHQKNINHLDVKPSNIMIRQDDYRVILIDFGLAKQYDTQGSQTSTTPVGISHGYAPMEQYKQGGVSTFSPQADIYALGATLYKLVTGKTPPQAMDVFSDGLPTLPSSISSSVANAIKKAMQPRKTDRPQSIAEFNLLIQTSKDKKKKYIRKKTSFGEEKNILDVQEKKHPETKEELKKRAQSINKTPILSKIFAIISFGTVILVIVFMYLLAKGSVWEEYQTPSRMIFLSVYLVIGGGLIFPISFILIDTLCRRKVIIKYIKQNPTDPVCKYLREELKPFTFTIKI